MEKIYCYNKLKWKKLFENKVISIPSIISHTDITIVSFFFFKILKNVAYIYSKILN